MTRLAVSLGALTECVDVLKTAKMAKNATLLTFTGPSFGLFALFEVTECGSETDRTRRGCELVATFPGYGHGEARKTGKNGVSQGVGPSDQSAQNGSRPPLTMPPAFIFTLSMRLEAFWTQIFSHTKFAPSDPGLIV